MKIITAITNVAAYYRRIYFGRRYTTYTADGRKMRGLKAARREYKQGNALHIIVTCSWNASSWKTGQSSERAELLLA